MNVLRWALATSAALGIGAACGYGGDASGFDAGAGSADSGGQSPDAAHGDGGAADGGPDSDGGILLDITPSLPIGQVNLEAEGALGWIHWNLDGNKDRYVTKATAPLAIPTFVAPAPNDLAPFDDYQTTFEWSNGSPQLVGGDKNGVYLKNPSPPSFTFTLPATTQARRLVLYVGVFSATAQLTATLGGQTSAAPPFDNANASDYVRYAIDFSASTAADLVVVWAMAKRYNGNSNITLSAATLATTP